MKLSLTPLLHTLDDFWQFMQTGSASSHLRCRSRQVKHPVRTRLGLIAIPADSRSADDMLPLATAIRWLAAGYTG